MWLFIICWPVTSQSNFIKVLPLSWQVVSWMDVAIAVKPHKGKILTNLCDGKEMNSKIALFGYIMAQKLSLYTLLGLYLGSRFLQTRGSCSSHALPLHLLSILWLSYCALVFRLCLIQLLSYILYWMKKIQWPFIWKVKVDLICNKWLFNSWCIICVCSRGIYHIKLKFLVYVHKFIFFSMPLVRIHLSFPLNFSYIGSFIS